MNVYDEAHSLAKAIKESNEFKEFDVVRKKVDEDPQLTEMLKQLQELQIQIQTAQMQGQEVDPTVMSQLQSVAAMAQTKPLAAEYMQKEATFSIMINDVFGIIGEAMGLK